MRILERYIAKEFVSTFVGFLLAFCSLYVIIDVLGHLDEIIQQAANLAVLRDYYVTFLPLIFIQTAPMSCLLSTLFTLGKLNRNNELVAMRASGLGIIQITKSIIIFSAMISVFTFVVSEKILPKSQALNSQLKDEIFNKNEKKNKITELRDLAVYGLKNRLFYIRSFNPATSTMQGITILESDRNQNLVAKIIADKGAWLNGAWHFYNCIIFYFDENTQIKDEPLHFDDKIMDISETPQDFLHQQKPVEFMNLAELGEYIKRLSQSQAKTALANFKVSYHYKISFPFASLILAFLGIPFSFITKRRIAHLASLGVCIAISFFYYLVMSVSLALGKGGALPAALSAWLANIVFFFLGYAKLRSLP